MKNTYDVLATEPRDAVVPDGSEELLHVGVGAELEIGIKTSFRHQKFTSKHEDLSSKTKQMYNWIKYQINS